MKDVYKIRKFEHGIITDPNMEESGLFTFSQLEGVEVKNGQLQRTKNMELYSHTTDLQQLGLTAVAPAVMNGTQYYIGINSDRTNYNDIVHIFDSNFNLVASGVTGSIGDLLHSSDSVVKQYVPIIKFNKTYRACPSLYFDYQMGAISSSGCFVGYIKQNRFNNAQSIDTIYLTNLYLDYAVYLSTNPFTVGATAWSGKTIKAGTYSFLMTFEYDGNQESNWYDTSNWSNSKNDYIFTYTASSDMANSCLVINVYLPETINYRVTGVNVYMGYSVSTAGNNLPDTGFYLVRRIDINNKFWAPVSSKHGITLQVVDDAATSFPAGFKSFMVNGSGYVQMDTDQLIFEELFSRNNAVNISQEWSVDSYKFATQIGARLFVAWPQWKSMSDGTSINTSHTHTDPLPYDYRQVVLYSQPNSPDVFFSHTDFIKIIDDADDYITGLHFLGKDLLVITKRRTFLIAVLDSGTILDYQIKDVQNIGTEFTKAQIVKDGFFWMFNETGLWVYNGEKYENISRGAYSEEIAGNLNSISKKDFGIQLTYSDTHERLFLFKDGSIYAINPYEKYALSKDDGLTSIASVTEDNYPHVFKSHSDESLISSITGVADTQVLRIHDGDALDRNTVITGNKLSVMGDINTPVYYQRINIKGYSNFGNLSVTVELPDEDDVSGVFATSGDFDIYLNIDKIAEWIKIKITGVMSELKIKSIDIPFRVLVRSQ